MAAAKEFNIGKDTLVDLWWAKGFSKDDLKPTSKLTEDMFRFLQQEFQGDKVAKIKSDQIDLPKGSLEGKKKKEDEPQPVKKETPVVKKVAKEETPGILQQQPAQQQPVQQPPVEEPVVVAARPVVEEAPVEVELVRIEAPELEGPKVIDKIDAMLAHRLVHPPRKKAERSLRRRKPHLRSCRQNRRQNRKVLSGSHL